jgi:aspartate racemase
MNFRIVENQSQVTDEIINHFQKNDDDFYPPISNRQSIAAYINSIFEMNGKLITGYIDDTLIAVVGFCLNHPKWKNYYQYIAIDKSYRKQRIATAILDKADEYFIQNGAKRVVVRTWSTNQVSQNLLAGRGFIHFETIIDDRGKGIHSYYYTKLLNPFQLKNKIEFLGIVGGMGTYSTGNFIKTISAIPRLVTKEQHLLPFVVINDPTIPDRTEYIYANRVEDLITKITSVVSLIDQQKISHIVFVCFTFHPFIQQVPLQKHVERINLLDVIKYLIAAEKKYFLIATKGTYLINSFKEIGNNIIIPGDEQKDEIHSIIMNIKSGVDVHYYKNRFIELAKSNQCDAIILGCTDLHNIFEFDRINNGIEIIDPLEELAFIIEAQRRKEELHN